MTMAKGKTEKTTKGMKPSGAGGTFKPFPKKGGGSIAGGKK